MSLKKIGKSLLIILVCIILIVILNFLRNLFIINSLEKKALNYKDLQNYHITWSTYSNNQMSIFDTYCKDDVYKQIVTLYDYDNFINNNETPSKTIFYKAKSEKNLVYYYVDKKIQSSNNDDGIFTITPQSFNSIGALKDDTRSLIITCLNSIITTSVCNGNNAYKVSPIFSIQQTVYYNKDTGYVLRTSSIDYTYQGKTTDTISDIIYEFNNVTDEDIAKPSMEGFSFEEIYQQ